MRIDTSYLFHCAVDGCDVTDVDHHADVSSFRLPSPRLPMGWQLVGALVFCPRHMLLLQVDGQVQSIPAASQEPEG